MAASKDIEIMKQAHDIIGLDRIMLRGSGKKSEEAAIALIEINDLSVESDVWRYAMEDPDQHHSAQFVTVLGRSGNPVYHELMETLLNKAYRNTHKAR